jgi:acetylornithine/N-succinyldiaminopimelate aminotransferase
MGLGRTGRMFSFEHWGISPDILVLAKALGGGMPLGAFIASREIMSTLTHDPELGHITTFGGHPMSCAAALASLRVILEERLADLAEGKGMRFEQVLAAHPAVKELRRKGLVMGAELQVPAKRKLFSEACLREHLIIDWFLFSPATFRIAPPLTISEEEIGLALDKLTKALGIIS